MSTVLLLAAPNHALAIDRTRLFVCATKKGSSSVDVEIYDPRRASSPHDFKCSITSACRPDALKLARGVSFLDYVWSSLSEVKSSKSVWISFEKLTKRFKLSKKTSLATSLVFDVECSCDDSMVDSNLFLERIVSLYDDTIDQLKKARASVERAQEAESVLELVQAKLRKHKEERRARESFFVALLNEKKRKCAALSAELETVRENGAYTEVLSDRRDEEDSISSAEPSLPEGWEVVPSTKNPNEVRYLNVHTKKKVKKRPMEPADPNDFPKKKKRVGV